MDFGSDKVMVEDWRRGAADPVAADPIATDLVATDPVAADPVAADPFAVLAEQLASVVTAGKIDPAALCFSDMCVWLCA